MLAPVNVIVELDILGFQLRNVKPWVSFALLQKIPEVQVGRNSEYFLGFDHEKQIFDIRVSSQKDLWLLWLFRPLLCHLFFGLLLLRVLLDFRLWLHRCIGLRLSVLFF